MPRGTRSEQFDAIQQDMLNRIGRVRWHLNQLREQIIHQKWAAATMRTTEVRRELGELDALARAHMLGIDKHEEIEE